MGACFQERSTEDCSHETLRKLFQGWVDDDACESGNDTYAGNLTTVGGLRIEDKVFDTYDQAIEYLQDNAQKWEYALAVKVRKLAKDFSETASARQLQDRINRLRDKHRAYSQSIVTRNERDEGLKGCGNCNGKIPRNRIRSHHCPICNHDYLITQTDRKRLRAYVEEIDTCVKQLNEQRIAYSRAHSKGTYWLVGAWCAE